MGVVGCADKVDFRVTEVVCSYSFGPVPLEDYTYEVVYQGPDAGNPREVLVRFSSPPANSQPYETLRWLQGGYPVHAYPKGAFDPIFGEPARVQFYFDRAGLHLIGLPQGLLLFRIPGETRSSSGQQLGQDVWLWLDGDYYTPFGCLDDTPGGLAHLWKIRGDGRRVAVVCSAEGTGLREAPSDSSGLVLKLDVADNVVLSGDQSGGWVKATAYRAIDETWRQASISSLDQALGLSSVQPLAGYVRAADVFELPDPLNEHALACILRIEEEGRQTPAAAVIVPTQGSYSEPVARLDDLAEALRAVEAKALVFALRAPGGKFGNPAKVRGQRASFLSVQGHLPEVTWDAEDVSAFEEIWEHYKSALFDHVDRWELPERLDVYKPELIRAFHLTAAAEEAWVKWGESYGPVELAVVERPGGGPALDAGRFLQILADTASLSAQELEMLQASLVPDPELGTGPEAKEQAYLEMIQLLSNTIMRRPWAPLYMDEAERMLQGG